MAKLYIFGIGGTGSRVLKSLAMLLASGIEMPNITDIIPIIVDPDNGNGDLQRTLNIISNYQKLHRAGASKDSSFFKSKIRSLDEEPNGPLLHNFHFDIPGAQTLQFKEFIDIPNMSRSNKAFTNLLFSNKNLDANMNVGFKGNPNIGSVVLNRFRESQTFRDFTQSFNEGDKIFIISSIFGGTGAAGFPLFLKNLRSIGNDFANHATINDAVIGAVSVLPYFDVRNDDNQTEIDSNTFIQKTKAALAYYERNICNNNSINALYYIGDNVDNVQEGADGDAAQQNNAHFVELAAALAIVDFADNTLLETANKKAVNAQYYEFGLETEKSDNFTFMDLADATKTMIAKPLTQYALMKSFWEKHYADAKKEKNNKFIHNGMNPLSGIDNTFVQAFEGFNTHFEQWLNELSNSRVSFMPLDLNKEGELLYDLVEENEVSWGLLKTFFTGKKGLRNMVTSLNKEENKFDKSGSPEKKYLALFSNVTGKILDKIIKL